MTSFDVRNNKIYIHQNESGSHVPLIRPIILRWCSKIRKKIGVFVLLPQKLNSIFDQSEKKITNVVDFSFLRYFVPFSPEQTQLNV